MPGGPVTPPPCRRCGSTVDYYSGGLCRRCHCHAPQLVDSCRDCLAWGARRIRKWLCKGCATWRRANSTVDACHTCGTVVTVDGNGFCRLCRKQATMLRVPKRPLDVPAANRHGQQLFLADLFQQPGAARRPVILSTALAAIRPVAHWQEVLLPADRDLRRVGVGTAAAWTVAGNELTIALTHHAEEHGRRHGWSHAQHRKVRQGIHILLALQDTPGAAITTSEAAQLTGTWLPVRSICEVLDAVGMLVDDREPAVRRWFRKRIAGLPATMRQEVTVWFTVLEQGSTISPRRAPRSESTIRVMVGWVVPLLTGWAAAGVQSLREISREDIIGALPERGQTRAEKVQGLRSLFAVLKQRKVIFANPTARLRINKPARAHPLPTDLARVRHALDSPDPARAALVALLAFHGLRSGDLRHLLLSDLRDARLHLNGRTILLAPAVVERLNRWLAYRSAYWPNTANPYLFVTFRTSAHTTPVSVSWVCRRIDLPGSAQAIREDRILHEAHATRGDARRLSDLFGLSVTAATRYTDTLDPPSSQPIQTGHRAAESAAERPVS